MKYLTSIILLVVLLTAAIWFGFGHSGARADSSDTGTSGVSQAMDGQNSESATIEMENLVR